MTARTGCWAVLSSVFLVSGFAQQTGSRTITLNVAVTDKAGKPVTGLQQGDFALLDNKKSQKILSFRAIDGGAAAAGQPVEILLVIDQINTPFIGGAGVRDSIEKFLGRNGGALTHPASVVLISDSGTAIRTEPSKDGNALIADLNKSDFGLRTIRRNEQMYAGADQQQLSIQALGQLADYEAARPGRKLAIWVSPGWPLFLGSSGMMTTKDQSGVFNSLVGLLGSFRRAQMTLYNINPIGPTEGAMQRSDFEQFFKGVTKPDQVSFGDLGVQALAYQSGGRVLDSSNDIVGEIATCAMDGTDYYALTFEGLRGDGANEYHELAVKVEKPKVTVRAPSGYYAQP